MSTEQENAKRQEEEYSASNIQVLEGLEAVRKRPAMYIGDIGEKGLHHLVYEVVDNSIDEALAGYCSDIFVTINEDNSISVRDNGRGIPTDFHEKEGKSALEVVLTVLHAGGKFDKGSYKVSGGLHGVGVSCVNALSTLLVAEVHRGGKIYKQTYSKGVPTSKVEIVGECEDRGTTVTFKPDADIFTHTTEYKYDILANRLRELAFLNKGIHLTLTDRRTRDENGEFRSEHYYSQDGLKEFVKYLDATRGETITESIIYLDTEKNGVPVEVAMQYNDSYSENVHSYVNNINTIEGGTHLTGFRRALTRTLKKYADDSGMLAKEKIEISGDDFRGPYGRHLGEGGRTPVRGADQDQAGQRRGGRSRRSGHVVRTGRLSGGEPARREGNRAEGDSGRQGPSRRPQGPRGRAAQDAPLGRRHAGQAGRLFEPRPLGSRDLLRRGRLGRRIGQAGP